MAWGFHVGFHTGANRRGPAAAREVDTRAADASGGATEFRVRPERETHRGGINVAEKNVPGSNIRRRDSGDAETCAEF